MAFMDEMVNTVYFVLHSKVQISIFVSRFVPHPFFVVSDPLISDIVLWTLVHNLITWMFQENVYWKVVCKLSYLSPTYYELSYFTSTIGWEYFFFFF